MNAQDINILVVEDDEIDIRALKRGFSEQKIENSLTIARDGLEALDVLRGKNGTPPLSRPYLILLDINMPRMNGIEFLEEISGDPSLSNSVVFVLSTSDALPDVLSAYENNVAGFLQKAAGGDDFSYLAQMLKFYMQLVQLPPEGQTD